VVFTLLFLVASYNSSAQLYFGDYLVDLRQYLYGAATYSTLSIADHSQHSQRAHPSHADLLEMGLPIAQRDSMERVNWLLKYIEQWTLDYYKDKGVIREGSDREAQMRNTTSLEDKDSALVIIYKSALLTTLKAVLRIQRLSEEKAQLPLEKFLKIALPRNQYKIVKNKKGQDIAVGDVAEIKNFLHNPFENEDLVPLLFFQARINGYFDDNFKTIEIDGVSYPLYPSLFYIHIDYSPENQTMLRYYQKLSFELYKAYEQQESAVLTISRDDLLRLSDAFEARPGQLMIDQAQGMVAGKFALLPFVKECEDNLTAPPNEYRIVHDVSIYKQMFWTPQN